MSSLHGFYRDRLSRLYLFRRGTDQSVEANDEQTLSGLSQSGSVAPYHLINTTLNLHGDNVETARGRQSDFFVFSKHFCGGPHTGYCRTRELEVWDAHVNLGTAMAISAAAAAPNMGSTTIRPLGFVLTLLNFRLGYWLPNPAHVNLHPPGRWRLPLKPRSRHLLREARGALDANRKLVNLSDGRHLENLAIYELLRRRCEIIIAVDGEADPDLTFGGLITLIRLAKIDLWITIDIDLSDLRRAENGLSTDHIAIGTIDYGSVDGVPQRGKLAYVKSSVTGSEAPFVQKYCADHPAFPHQTTADVFFNEVQFEAYRALGNQAGERLLDLGHTRDMLGL